MKSRSLIATGIAIAIVLALLSLLLYVRMTSLSVPFAGASGNDWLGWNKSTKELYITAYVQGMIRGYSRGCDSAISLALPTVEGPKVSEAFNRCWSRFPISAQDSIKLIGPITEFYKDYPDQRSFYVADILLGLHSGLSTRQIHERSSCGGGASAK